MQTVFAAFQDRAQAERARDELVQRGFDREDIHIEQPDAMQAGQPEPDDARGSAGISGFFSSLFGSSDDYAREGQTWHEAVQRGRSVVVVDADDERRASEAVSCLRALGAMNLDEPNRKQPGGGASSAGKEGVLEVVQEELSVGKRNVDQGGVRVIQRVSSKPVRELLQLREERAVVERRPVNRAANATDMAAFKEGSMEVRESSEEAVVSKTARVVEEVRVGKEVREREQVVEDNLRRKDVEVERFENAQRGERAVASDDSLTPAKGGRGTDSPTRSTLSTNRKKTDGSGPV